MTSVKTLLLTRPLGQSRSLARDIETSFPGQSRCLISPLMLISPMGSLPDTSNFQALLFTSVNGVKAFATLGGTSITPCFCVGARTTKAAQDVGLNSISANGSASDLTALVLSELDPTKGPLLYVRGENAAGDVSATLSGKGFTLVQAVLYTQKPIELTEIVKQALMRGDALGLPLYSTLTAHRMVKVLKQNPDWPTENLTALCISENVGTEVRKLPFRRIEITAEPNGIEMLSLIGQYLR